MEVETTVNLLVVENDRVEFLLIERSLRQHGLDCRLTHAPVPEGESEASFATPCDAVLLSCGANGQRLGSLLDRFRAERPDTAVVVLTRNAADAAAVDALRLAIDGVVSKDRLAQLGIVLVRAIERRAAHRDIADLKQQVGEARARLQRTLEGGKILAWEVDATTGRLTQYREVDGLFERPAGYHFSGFDELLQSVHEADREMVRNAVGAAMAGSRDLHIEFRGWTMSGKPRWISAVGRVERLPDGRPLRLYGVATDITARKSSEVALQSSEAFNRNLLDALVDGVFVAQDYRFAFANPALPAILGYTHEEFVGLSFEAVIAPEFLDLWNERFALRIANEGNPPSHYEVRVQGKDGRTLWLELRATRIEYEQRPAVLGILRDISERKLAQDALAESESRANLILDMVPEAMLLVDPAGRIVRANRRAENIFGYSASTFQGKPVGELIPERFRAGHGVKEAAFRANPHARQMGDGRELVALRSDGSEFPVEAALGPVPIDGQPHVIVTLADISQRRDAALELKRYEQIVNTSPDMLAFVDRDLCYQVVNPVYAAQVGASAADLAGRRIRDVLHEDTWRQIEPLLQRALAGDEMRFSSSRVFADGVTHVLDATYRPFAVEGEVLGIVVSHRDITDRVKAETALVRESYRNQWLLRNASDGIVILDEKGRVVEASESFCSLLGSTREDVLGCHVSTWDAQWSVEELEGVVRRAMGSDVRNEFETICRRVDGSLFEAEVSTQSIDIDGQRLLFCSMRDISQRRAAERALIESQTVIERAQEMAHLGNWTLDFDKDVVLMSAELQRILEWPTNTCAGMELMRLVHPDDAERVLDAWRGCMLDGESLDSEYRIVIEGVVKHLHVRGEPQCDESGRVHSAIGFTQDVTDLREAERALEAHASRLEDEVAARTTDLAAAEAKFRGLVEQSFAAIDILQDGYFRYVNPAFANIFGYDSPEDLVDKVPAVNLIGAEDRERVLENIRVRSEVNVEGLQYEFVGIRRDGTRIDVEVFGRHFIYEGRPATIGLVIDITQRKLAEQAKARALAEAERLAQVRRDFLANMSHEIRTPLSAILGLAQIGMREDVGRRSSRTFARILDSGQLLLGVINDILDFSKIEAGKLSVEMLPFDPSEAVDRAIGFVAPQAQAKGLEFIVDEAADLPSRCAGDKLRLSQVLVNLLSNAVKFTEHGSVRLRVSRDGDRLRFDIIDSGIGIPPDQLARLFRPFEQGDTTTTRRFGGTGLGLTISSRLAGLMGGELTAQSRVGEGSTFTLRLPLCDAGEQARPRESLRMVLAGFADVQATRVVASLGERGVDARLQTLAAAFDMAADLVVIEGAAFDAATAAAARREIGAGRRVAIVGRCETRGIIDDVLRANLIQIDPPLRARLLIAAAHTESLQAERVSSDSRRLLGVRVLAAEDNAVNREVLGEILSLEGAQYLIAEDGEQAVAALERDGAQAYDVMLTDIQMPGIDGYETARRMLALAPSLPVMGLTAHAMRDERERCLAAGMVEHIAKPIDINELVDAVLRHVRRPGAPVAGSAATGATQPDIASRNAAPPAASSVASSVPVVDVTAGDPAQPIVDWAALERRFPGRPAFIERLGQTLLRTQLGTPARLREVAPTRDHEQIAFLAHTLKGVAGNLMAKPMEALARDTEAAARAAQGDAADMALRLADALEAVIGAVRIRFPEAEAAATLAPNA